MSRKSVGELSYEVRLLTGELEKVKEGDTITYEELGAAVERDVKHDKRYLLESARQIVRRDSHVVFDAVRGVGLKRLSDEAVVETVVSVLPKRMRSLGKSAGKRLSAVNHENLSQEGRAQRDMGVALVGMLDITTKSSSLKRLSSAISSAEKELPMKNVMLELCG